MGFILIYAGYNYVGMMSATSSEAVFPDSSPPEGGQVIVGEVNAHVSTVLCDNVKIYWRGFKDLQSATLHYKVGVGSNEYSDDVYSFTAVSSNFASLEGLAIEEGHAYYALVKVSQKCWKS